MPAKYEGRTIDLEKGLATRLKALREEAGLSYQQLADRMKAVGCDIYPSGIQKTEKAGRRITVEELVGYARAFDVSLMELLGDSPTDNLGELWGVYMGLERLSNVKRAVGQEYGEALREIQASARENPELVIALRDRHDKYLAAQTERAKRDAYRDGEDVSTPEALEAYLDRWGVYEIPAIAASADVLEGADNGEGQ